MTAMSAQSASETPSTATQFIRDLVASLRTVQLPGSPATYANRATLREMGLRWDPAGYRWHGTTTAAAVKTLREQLHLEVRVFGVLDGGAPRGPAAPKPVPPRPAPLPTTIPSGPRDPPRDYSRSRFESRLAFPGADDGEGTEELWTPTRRFTLLEITSGLPDDSREADEREEARRLRDLRGRVKAARAVVSRMPGLDETLANDWQKAARFYAGFGITEVQFRRGADDASEFKDGLGIHSD
jgi:hypothetical protein